MEFFQGWKFDIRTALITVVLAPLLLFLLKIILKYLKYWGGYILEGAMYWFSRFLMRSLAGALTLKRYCRLQLSDWNQYLHVPSSLDIKLNIDQVYVTLILELQGAYTKYNHTDLLNVGNRIRVIGDPGSGKTSLIKRLFRDACHRAIKSPRRSQLPILVELKNLEIPDEIKDRDAGLWFYKKLRTDTEKSAVYQMGECFDTYARSTGLLILLDGLDEVSTKYYPKIQAAIHGLSEELAHMSESNNIVVTMRTQFHQQIKENYRERFAHALFLKAFSPSDIYEFLTRWPFGKGVEQNISRIYKDLTDRPTLREMCSNPLILSMYVAEDQAAGHIVAPETRTEFYSKVTEELIIRRRLQQIGPAVAATKLREQRERILGRLAYEHLLDSSQSINSLQWSEALKIVMEVMNCSESDAETTFRDLAKETGLITEERIGQTFRFIHLTFCEFLAAFEAVEGQKSGWNSLINVHKSFQEQTKPELRSRLMEVIPFACGLLPRIKRYDAITDVSTLGSKHLLALSFLETKLYDHPNWPAFVSTQQQSLLSTPEEDWDEQWLRELHIFNVVVRDANNSSVHMPTIGGEVDLASFFQTLVAQQKDSLSTLLSAYATQDAAAAFRLAEICNLDLAADFPEIIVANCDQPPFFALIREQALHELNRIELWASLLSEAALRSRAVANTMMQLNPSTNLEELIGRVPKKRRWFKRPYVPKSLYTQLISLAVNADPKINERLTMLQAIRNLPAPSSQPWHGIWLCLAFSMFGLVILTITVSNKYIFGERSLVRFVITEIGLIGSIFWAMYVAKKMKDLETGYGALLQIGNFNFVRGGREPAGFWLPVNLLRLIMPSRLTGITADFLGRKHRKGVQELLILRSQSWEELAFLDRPQEQAQGH